MNKSIWKRFWSKVHVKLPKDCWEWQANLGKGYGMFWFGKDSIVAHRVSLRGIAIKYNTTHTTIKRAIDDGRIALQVN